VSAAPILAKILPASAFSEEMALPAAPDALLPEEAERTRGFSPKRLAEYRATRHCARRALARLGIRNFPVLSAPDRAPIWPEGVAGSITHTGNLENGWCGVAVAGHRDLLSVGIDAEDDAPLTDEIWDDVLTSSERDALASVSHRERGLRAKIAFSAKEALYKCQYPLSGEFLGFQEVAVSLDARRARFAATFLRDVGTAFSCGDALYGRYVHASGLVVTAVWISAKRPG
jgi:4'-phosphopantetheinyl transferase EntD